MGGNRLPCRRVVHVHADELYFNAVLDVYVIESPEFVPSPEQRNRYVFSNFEIPMF